MELRCHCGNQLSEETAEAEDGLGQTWSKCSSCSLLLLRWGPKTYFARKWTDDNGKGWVDLWSTEPSETEQQIWDYLTEFYKKTHKHTDKKGTPPPSFTGPSGVFVVDPELKRKFDPLRRAREREREAARDN